VLSPQKDSFNLTWLAKEKSLDSASPYQFLYSPSMNALGELTGVADVAPGGSEFFQELRVFGSGGSTLLASSRGVDPASPIFRFVSLAPARNAAGQAAFLGIAKGPSNANVTTLWLVSGGQLRAIARDDQGEVKKLELFSPSINASGLVAFRGIGTDGLRAIWISDGEQTRRVVREHDVLPSDRGPARIDHETPTNPVFAGTVSVNDRGDVSFIAGLTPPDDDQEEWGTAAYLALASSADAGTDAGALDDAGVISADGGSAAHGGNPSSTRTGDADGPDPSAEAGMAAARGCDCRTVDGSVPAPWFVVVVAVGWLAQSRRARAKRRNAL
jgi:hypothetical protein